MEESATSPAMMGFSFAVQKGLRIILNVIQTFRNVLIRTLTVKVSAPLRRGKWRCRHCLNETRIHWLQT
jgi:hypothetical protein